MHKGLHFVLLAVILIVFAGAGAELAFEVHQPGSNIHDFGDAIWWAVVTVTTVGYGDRYPVGTAGRGVALVLMLVGIGLGGAVTATVASYRRAAPGRADRRAGGAPGPDRGDARPAPGRAQRCGTGNDSRPELRAERAQGPERTEPGLEKAGHLDWR